MKKKSKSTKQEKPSETLTCPSDDWEDMPGMYPMTYEEFSRSCDRLDGVLKSN